MKLVASLLIVFAVACADETTVTEPEVTEVEQDLGNRRCKASRGSIVISGGYEVFSNICCSAPWGGTCLVCGNDPYTTCDFF